MDPLSIAASVSGLTGACLVTVKKLGEVASRFRNAPQTLIALTSEVKVIRVSLCQLQNILIDDANSITTQAVLEADVREALDISLTGCTMTMSCLDNELHPLIAKAGSQSLGFTDRTKIVWKNDKFKEHLQQLRGQHGTLAVLQQGLQMKSITDIHRLVRSNQDAIHRVANRTNSLRGLYPQVNVAKSFLGSEEGVRFDDGRAESIISEREFGFDEVLINTKQYRQVFVNNLRKTTSQDMSISVQKKHSQNIALARRPLQVSHQKLQKVQEEKSAQQSDSGSSKTTISSVTFAWERLGTLNSSWESLASSWSKKLEENPSDIESERMQKQVVQHIVDMSEASATLFESVSQIEETKSSYQRWFLEEKEEKERSKQILAEMGSDLESKNTAIKNSERKIRQLLKETNELKLHLDKAATEHSQVLEMREVEKSEKERIVKGKEEVESALEIKNAALKESEDTVEQLTKENSHLRLELREYKNEIVEVEVRLSKSIRELENNAEIYSSDLEIANDRFNTLAVELKGKSAQWMRQSQELKDKKTEVEGCLTESRREVQEALAREEALESKLRESEASIKASKDLLKKKRDLEEQNAETLLQLSHLKTVFRACNTSLVDTRSKISEIEQLRDVAIHDLTKKLEITNSELEMSKTEMYQLQEDNNSLSMRLYESEANYRDIEQRMDPNSISRVLALEQAEETTAQLLEELAQVHIELDQTRAETRDMRGQAQAGKNNHHLLQEYSITLAESLGQLDSVHEHYIKRIDEQRTQHTAHFLMVSIAALLSVLVPMTLASISLAVFVLISYQLSILVLTLASLGLEMATTQPKLQSSQLHIANSSKDSI